MRGSAVRSGAKPRDPPGRCRGEAASRSEGQPGPGPPRETGDRGGGCVRVCVSPRAGAAGARGLKPGPGGGGTGGRLVLERGGSGCRGGGGGGGGGALERRHVPEAAPGGGGPAAPRCPGVPSGSGRGCPGPPRARRCRSPPPRRCPFLPLFGAVLAAGASGPAASGASSSFGARPAHACARASNMPAHMRVPLPAHAGGAPGSLHASAHACAPPSLPAHTRALPPACPRAGSRRARMTGRCPRAPRARPAASRRARTRVHPGPERVAGTHACAAPFPPPPFPSCAVLGRCHRHLPVPRPGPGIRPPPPAGMGWRVPGSRCAPGLG